ncbi:type II secretion system protein GspM [Luteimonas sp. RD2P54]|uniref:Type II secretion system protein GspM n=1 Tax=Luteimonas endophytica TaxID=3042023 RepID=A0ABT6JBZ4_9GAMM|nr:type II secretion system protein GspM [Luteimonas endophytica]MDH5824137.1 type II secretion system protein GspM [Luteimonas endophytica]
MTRPSKSARLADWWHAREPRERWMVSAMLIALAAFALWYGAIAPLRQARDAARERHAAAAAALREIESALAYLEASAARLPPAPAGDAFARAIADSAGAAGVAIGRQDHGGGGGEGVLVVAIDAVDAAALFGWIDALRRDHGIVPTGLQVDKRGGRLRAELRFAPPLPAP